MSARRLIGCWLPSWLPPAAALLLGACAAAGGAASVQPDTHTYALPFDQATEAAAEALRDIRMEIVRAEQVDAGTYLMTGQFVNAYARTRGQGDTQVATLEVVVEAVGDALRITARPPRGPGYGGGSQGRTFTERFFRALHDQGLTPLD